MVAWSLDLGVDLVTYGFLLVVVALWFVLLFRVVDGFALEDSVEGYDDANPEGGPRLHATPTVDGDEVICPRCGQHNEREFTYCRDCLARIGG